MTTQKEPERYEGVETRIQLIALGLAIALGVLCLQFWQLQIVHLNEFRAMADDNMVRKERLQSDRGVIYGRNDVILADNRASADIFFVPGDCPEEKRREVCENLEQLIGISTEDLMERVEAYKHSPFSQILVKRDVTKWDRVRVEEHGFELDGVVTVVHPQRRYLHGEIGGQLLGYLGEINKHELETSDNYHMGDLVGRRGLQSVYENVLHGRDGYMLVTKYASGRPQMLTDKHGMPYIAPRDSLGQFLEIVGRRQDPDPGNPLHLTLDIELQEACQNFLKGEVGAIVVLEAETGGVLAMASHPGYDPSVFVTRSGSSKRMELLTAEHPNPMLNRAYREQYPPGSVFKVLLASAALEEGVIDEDTTFFCPGYFRINNKGRAIKCWRHIGHGKISVVDALAYSCDVFFFNVGLELAKAHPELGPDNIAAWAAKMGVGVRTGVDLPGEIPGLMPTRAWKKRLFQDQPPWEQRWYDGDTVNLSIGQGSAATTPLQNAVMMACIVNGGYRVRPYFNRALGPERSEKFLSDKTLEVVVKGMRKCVEDTTRGTGRPAYTEGMTLIGKTGSAQVVRLALHEEYETEEDIPYELRDHAWFVCGVLDREPKIAICVLVEHGHHGGAAAAPLAKQVIDFFYANEAAKRGMMARQDAAGGGEERAPL